MALFLRGTAIVLIGLVMLTVLAFAVGHAQAAPDWTEMVHCRQPCWAGLNPDITTAARAWRVLETQPQFTLSGSSPDSRSFEMVANGHRYTFSASVEVGQDLTTFKIVPHDPIYLGDVTGFFGSPDFYFHWENCASGHCTDYIYLWFARQRVEAVFEARDSLTLRADSRLQGFIIGQLEMNLRRGCPWRGLSMLTPSNDCYLTNRR